MKKILILSCFLILSILCFEKDVKAQTFGTETGNEGNTSSVTAVKGLENIQTEKNTDDKKADENKSEKKSSEDSDDEDIFIPEEAMARPTKDGSKRGGALVYRLGDDGKKMKATNKIFMYYKDFKMSNSINGHVSCDLSIWLVTDLDRRLINLDAKLIWPGMGTVVSFSNVMPNTPTYYNYTLLGDGCYNLDKMPNIVVNRCRVKGMSSSQCASNIIWLDSRSGSGK